MDSLDFKSSALTHNLNQVKLETKKGMGRRVGRGRIRRRGRKGERGKEGRSRRKGEWGERETERQ